METENETPKKKTPLNAIRSQCVNCVGNTYKDIQNCGGHGKTPPFSYCQFYPYRLGKGRPKLKSIRKFCLDCMGNSSNMVFHCSTVTCPLYPYREGKNPSRKGQGNIARLKPKK